MLGFLFYITNGSCLTSHGRGILLFLIHFVVRWLYIYFRNMKFSKLILPQGISFSSINDSGGGPVNREIL